MSLTFATTDSGTQISAATWRTVHEHLVTDAFRSKKSSSALFLYAKQTSQKWYLSSHHSTTCGDYKRHIYEKQLNGDLKGFTFVILAFHEQVALMSSF